jgi:hypothetical protein
MNKIDKPLASPFKSYNTMNMRHKSISKYLQDNYDVDRESVELFLKFIGKSLHEKIMLYKNYDVRIYRFSDSLFDSEFSSEEETDIKKKAEYYNLPDIEFENEMREEFQMFREKLLEDGQSYLYFNTFIDDFYRLFARYYNPVF